jgi:hypothetical protein
MEDGMRQQQPCHRRQGQQHSGSGSTMLLRAVGTSTETDLNRATARDDSGQFAGRFCSNRRPLP